MFKNFPEKCQENGPFADKRQDRKCERTRQKNKGKGRKRKSNSLGIPDGWLGVGWGWGVHSRQPRPPFWVLHGKFFKTITQSTYCYRRWAIYKTSKNDVPAVQTGKNKTKDYIKDFFFDHRKIGLI